MYSDSRIPREGTETQSRSNANTRHTYLRVDYPYSPRGDGNLVVFCKHNNLLLLITLIPREGTETIELPCVHHLSCSVDYPYSPRGDGNNRPRIISSGALSTVAYPYSPRGVLIDANQLTLVLLRRNRRAFCVYCLLLCRWAIPSMARLILRKGRLRDRQT